MKKWPFGYSCFALDTSVSDTHVSVLIFDRAFVFRLSSKESAIIRDFRTFFARLRTRIRFSLSVLISFLLGASLLIGASSPARATTEVTSVTGTPGNGQVALSWVAPTSVTFPFSFNGINYDSVYVGSNTYLTFGGGSSQYSGLAANSPALPGVHMCSADNSYQRVQFLINNSVTPNQLRIRYEGTASTGGSVGSPNIIYEAVFYRNQNYFDVLIGTHARCTGGLRVVTNGSSALASPGFAANTNWRITGGTVTQNGNTATWLGSSASSTASGASGFNNVQEGSVDDSFRQVPVAPTGYAIRYSSNSGTNWTQFTTNTGSTATSSTVTGLANATSYIFQVAPFYGSTGTTGAWSASSPTYTTNGATISYSAGTGGSGTAPSSPVMTSIGSTFVTPANT